MILRGTDDPVWLVAVNINAFVKRLDVDNINPLEQKTCFLAVLQILKANNK